ncbi:MAG: mevalonate 5-phosphate dehydratase small subunit [Methanolobus sp.]|nr:mevalonate 5-phosphate dehydratase small subunit [Methanolobus sp.]
MRVNCRKISRGVAEGQVLLTREAISFLGNVDPKTGVIVEPKHELFGQCIKDRVLVFPHGKGSTVGSYVLYQLIKNNVAPAAMINSESEPIVAVGAIISGIPLVDRMEQDPFKFLKNGDTVRIDGTNGVVETIE